MVGVAFIGVIGLYVLVLLAVIAGVGVGLVLAVVSVTADASSIRCFGFDVDGFAFVFITGGVCAVGVIVVVSFTNALHKFFVAVVVVAGNEVYFRGGAEVSSSVGFLGVRLLVSAVGAIVGVLLSVSIGVPVIFNVVVLVFGL